MLFEDFRALMDLLDYALGPEVNNQVLVGVKVARQYLGTFKQVDKSPEMTEVIEELKFELKG